MPLCTIEEAIDDIRQGRMVIMFCRTYCKIISLPPIASISRRACCLFSGVSSAAMALLHKNTDTNTAQPILTNMVRPLSC